MNRGVRNGEKSRTRFGIFKDSFKIQGFARDSGGFTKNYGDSAIHLRFSKRFRDSAKDSGIQEGIHSRFSKIQGFRTDLIIEI